MPTKKVLNRRSQSGHMASATLIQAPKRETLNIRTPFKKLYHVMLCHKWDTKVAVNALKCTMSLFLVKIKQIRAELKKRSHVYFFFYLFI